jgi:diguanylate cyclase (GGDEF)-like protein
LPAAVDRRTSDFIAAARTLAESSDKIAQDPAYQRVYKDADAALLAALDQAVKQFEAEANLRVDRLKRIQQIVLVILLTTLLVEARFIFRPLVKRVHEYAIELYEMASTDGLTGLANRRHFVEVATRDVTLAHRSSRPLALLMVDIDHFKRVNDNYGHQTGDAVLQRFAEHTRRSLRRSDFIGRVGGEEFAILLPGADPDGATAVAEKLRGEVEAAKDDNPKIPRYTISVGIACLEPADAGLDDLMRRADNALYGAKNEGRNRAAYLPTFSRFDVAPAGD